MLNTSLSPWPSFSAEEADAVARVVLSNKVNYWTGTECREFEKEFAAWCGVPHAVALANGTLALDVALKALGIGPGDEVVVFYAGHGLQVRGRNFLVPVDADIARARCSTASRCAGGVRSWPCLFSLLSALSGSYRLICLSTSRIASTAACSPASKRSASAWPALSHSVVPKPSKARSRQTNLAAWPGKASPAMHKPMLIFNH